METQSPYYFNVFGRTCQRAALAISLSALLSVTSAPAQSFMSASGRSVTGTTLDGGASGSGTVFRVNHDGSGYATVHSFTGAGGDGANPGGPVMQASDGMIYGTTSTGGSSSGGAVFKLDANGGNYQVLHRFMTNSESGNPTAGLVEGLDGRLYGTTTSGGSTGSGGGTIFRMDKNGTGFVVVHSFTSAGSVDGYSPNSTLTQAPDGSIYGSTSSGGDSGLGTAFRFVQAPLYPAPTTVTAAHAANYRVVVRNAALPSGVSPSPFILTVLADSDGDGLPDTWESTYNVGNADADDDGDGFTNGQEYTAGTNPTNAASRLSIEDIHAGSQVTLTFGASSNKTYTIQSADKLGGAWSRVADVAARAVNHTATMSMPVSTTNRYYRVVSPRQP